MATTPTLLCKQCNFENEPERVYCHNCGAKLDRALLPAEATKREDPQVVQERVRNVVRPKTVAAGPLLKHLLFSLVIAAVLAAVLQMCRAPAGAPNLSQDAAMTAPAISDDLEDALQSPVTRRLVYTEDQVNGFLQSSIRTKEDSSYGISRKFDRAFVHFQEGTCQVVFQQSIFGYPLYASTVDRVTINNGQLVTQPVAGSIGRLALPAKIMPYMEKTFSALWKVLDADKKLVARMNSITFHKGSVEMVKTVGVK